MMALLPFIFLALVSTSCFSADEMTIARLQDIVNSKEAADICDELKIYPACDHMKFSQRTMLPSGDTRVDTASASEWYVVGDFLVIKSPRPDQVNEFLVKSYDKANRLYHGWCFSGDKMLFTQIGMYDAEHRIMTWRAHFQNDQAGVWSISIQRFVSATRNEWLTNVYKETEWLATQNGSCDYSH